MGTLHGIQLIRAVLRNRTESDPSLKIVPHD